MPTVTISSQISDAIYIISIIGLSILLARPVYLVFSASQERGAEEVSSGLASVIDGMPPGTSVIVGLPSYPGVQLSVVLSGSTVTASFGESTVRTQVKWALPDATLSPGQTYNLTVVDVGGRGEVMIGA